MANIITSTYHWLLEALFPRRCLGCKAWGTWCCPKCLASLTFPRQLHCLGCGATTPLGEFCVDCCADHSLTGVWVGLRYANPLIRACIKAYKFNGIQELKHTLGSLAAAVLMRFNLPPAWHAVAASNWRLVPVPLAKRREKERGFNQAALLATSLSELTSLPVLKALIRTRNTKAQSTLVHEARAQNMAKAFALAPEVDVKGLGIILVDDVYTTGATLEECARMLIQAGATEVWGLVVARG